MVVSSTIAGLLISILGILMLGFATILFQMPNFPHPRIKRFVYIFLRRGKRLQTAKESVQAGRVTYKSDPDDLETITPILKKEFDIRSKELNGVKYTHMGVKIDHRGNRSTTLTDIDNPKEHIAQLVENEQIPYFKTWGGRILIVGIVLSILGVVITFVF